MEFQVLNLQEDGGVYDVVLSLGTTKSVVPLGLIAHNFTFEKED